MQNVLEINIQGQCVDFRNSKAKGDWLVYTLMYHSLAGYTRAYSHIKILRLPNGLFLLCSFVCCVFLILFIIQL